MIFGMSSTKPVLVRKILIRRFDIDSDEFLLAQSRWPLLAQHDAEDEDEDDFPFSLIPKPE